MSHRVLVTGGTDFIGSHVVDALVAEGYEVIVVDALVPQVHGTGASKPRFLPGHVPFIRADVCDAIYWAHARAGVDTVIHLAAEVGVGQSMYEIVRYVRANTLGTAVLPQALLQHKGHIQKLMVGSSMSLYGEGAYTYSRCCPIPISAWPPFQRALAQWQAAAGV